MATLNHTNLTTYDVPALAEFFRSVFGFQLNDAHRTNGIEQ